MCLNEVVLDGYRLRSEYDILVDGKIARVDLGGGLKYVLDSGNEEMYFYLGDIGCIDGTSFEDVHVHHVDDHRLCNDVIADMPRVEDGVLLGYLHYKHPINLVSKDGHDYYVGKKNPCPVGCCCK